MNQHDIWQQPAFHQTGSTRYMSLVSSFYPLRSQPSSLNVQNRRIRRTSETQPCHWLGFQKKTRQQEQNLHDIFLKPTVSTVCVCKKWRSTFPRFRLSQNSPPWICEPGTARNHQKNMSDRFPSRSGFPMEKTTKTSSHMTSREIFWRHCERTSKKRLLVS